MHNFQSYFSKFSQGTYPQHSVNTRKSPLFPKKAPKKVHFFPKSTQKSPFSPSYHAKKSHSVGKAPLPNSDLATDLHLNHWITDLAQPASESHHTALEGSLLDMLDQIGF